jgi:beta-lactamase class A
MSLRDLSYLMLTISDNVATDAVIAAVGIDAVNRRLENLGCADTAVVGTLQAMLKGFAADLGYESYDKLLATPVAVDPVRFDRCRALDASQASHTTARDSTTLLAAVWNDTAASPEACAALRAVMAQQLTRRFARLVVQGGSLAAKSGALFGRVRNEIGVVTDPDGESYAVAVLTRALKPFDGPARQAKIDDVMATAAAGALDELRRR